MQHYKLKLKVAKGKDIKVNKINCNLKTISELVLNKLTKNHTSYDKSEEEKDIISKLKN